MTGRYYGEDHTEFFYPPSKFDEVSKFVSAVIAETGKFPTKTDWEDFKQPELKPIPNLWGAINGDEFGGTTAELTFNEILTEQELLNALKDSQKLVTSSYNQQYHQNWVEPAWEDHMKVTTDYTSALESTKGLTKHMLTSSVV